MEQLTKYLVEFGITKPEVIQLSIPKCSEIAYAVKIDSAYRYVLWDYLKDKKDALGLCPLVTATWGSGSSWKSTIVEEEFFSRYGFNEESARKDLSPQSIISRSRNTKTDSILTDHNKIYSEDLVDQIDYSVEHIRHAYGKSPSEQDVLTAMQSGSVNNYFDLQQWFLKWCLSEIGLDKMSSSDNGYLDWYEPKDQKEAILMLPIKNSFEALAYVHWYGAEGVSTEVAIAMFRKWSEKYQAELVAHYGTMLHVTVATRPDNINESFSLAVEQESLAPCTTALPGAALHEFAVSLMSLNNWFLHERP